MLLKFQKKDSVSCDGVKNVLSSVRLEKAPERLSAIIMLHQRF